jgi:hypothetical protein
MKLLSSLPYYAQANGQAESSNKTPIKLIKKKIKENPKRWHEVLSEALWAHHIFKHSATKVTPFELVYGQEAILPVEVNLDALRIARQNELLDVDYHNLMLDRLDEVSNERVKALGKIERDKLRVAKAYIKRAKEKSFQVGDLVWKMILPIGSRRSKFRKWSPNWEAPFRIEEVVPGNSYMG